MTTIRTTIVLGTIILLLACPRAVALDSQLALTNAALVVSVNTSNATFSVLDRRTGRLWTQRASRTEVAVTEAHTGSNEIALGLRHVPSGLVLNARIVLEAAKPEFTVSLVGEGALSGPVRYPYPFVSEPADRLIVPMDEGISFPVEDKSVETFRLIAYGGHGICMAFWGVTDDRQGHGVIIETPDDAAIHLVRLDDLLAIAPEWDAQKGQFGYLHGHNSSVTRRDPKPENLILTRDARVKILDFGQSREEPMKLVPQDFGGTWLYEAPETYRAAGPEHDIYAFGVAFWSSPADFPAKPPLKSRVPFRSLAHAS